jgi:hypothetical protein
LVNRGPAPVKTGLHCLREAVQRELITNEEEKPTGATAFAALRQPPAKFPIFLADWPSTPRTSFANVLAYPLASARRVGGFLGRQRWD